MNYIWKLCFANMKQRGIRTFLTILGVVIGVVSIVTMLALGIGVKKQLLNEVITEGSVTDITVTSQNYSNRKDSMVTDRTMEKMLALDHVDAVYPMLEFDGNVEYKNYICYGSIIGTTKEFLEREPLLYGELPEDSFFKPNLVMGGNALEIFFNENSFVSYSEMNKPDQNKDSSKQLSKDEANSWKNLVGEAMELETRKYGDEATASAKTKVVISAVMDNNSYNVFCNMDTLKKLLKRLGENQIPYGQPMNKDGSPYSYWVYNSAIISVDDVSHVETVVNNLKDLGFQAESNKQYVDSIQKTLKMMELLLGGIGMIALVVAVIGIGNTMTTAVYERIHEIGVLKVLGCDPSELLDLFLLESAILGGIGGIFGVILSFIICHFGVDHLAVKMFHMENIHALAVIEPWLAVFAIIFAILLGVIAGYFPAKYAARLKPIDAVQKS